MSNEIMYEMVNGELVEMSDATKATFIATQENATTTANFYTLKRSAEYPPITDYLDGVVKGDQTQINKYIADCLAVKAKYPKP
jgi:hypothetical protein